MAPCSARRGRAHREPGRSARTPAPPHSSARIAGLWEAILSAAPPPPAARRAETLDTPAHFPRRHRSDRRNRQSPCPPLSTGRRRPHPTVPIPPPQRPASTAASARGRTRGCRPRPGRHTVAGRRLPTETLFRTERPRPHGRTRDETSRAPRTAAARAPRHSSPRPPPQPRSTMPRFRVEGACQHALPSQRPRARKIRRRRGRTETDGR
mmetsp:Transcript_41570/g.74721  ORF Transcript_41570/g.74721 Transcript_41570/m.74721 type:complete len:209 (-) Transcript_41570:2987-3613(-)